MVIALYIGVGALAVALALWVYFDAMELGKPAVGWALAQPLLGWMLFLPLILYVIFREHGPRRVVPPGGAQRQMVYIFSLTGFGMAAFALSLLLGTTIAELVGDVDSEDYRSIVAASLTVLLFGTALWAALWFPAVQRLPSMPEDDRFRATFYLHRGYLFTVIILSGIIAFISGLWLVGGLLSALADAGELETEDWLPSLGPLSIALLALALHYEAYVATPAYRELQARFDAIPPPPFLGAQPPDELQTATATAAPVSPRFCGQCGAHLSPGQRFCPSCGAAVNPG